jgi:uncharacterized repeat protein (TIGR03803 family)
MTRIEQPHWPVQLCRSLILATITLLAVVPLSSAQVYEKVYSFTDAQAAATTDKGSIPSANMIQGADGNFYGTSKSGGANNLGTIFKMTPAGVLTTLVDFTGNGTTNRGAAPCSSLIQGSDGNFYGTTQSGGADADGTVFQMTPAGVLTTLVDFTDNGTANRGDSVFAGLVQGSDGNFYGTTQTGGADEDGTVFRMTPAGALTTLVDFTGNGGANRGANPFASLTQGDDGNFYGTTQYGGANGDGTVFQITPAGVLTTLVDFTGNAGNSLGQGPQATLLKGSNGDFYGTTWMGGVDGFGTVFQVTVSGSLTVLYSFTAQYDGNNPIASLAQGSDGNFYGTTFAGGGNSSIGTVFRITPAGALTTLVRFSENTASYNGGYPSAGLIQGSDGNFYGTTQAGGASNLGTVFRMTATGALTTLVQFTGNGAYSTGSYPLAALVQGSGGNFYGTTEFGGASNAGTVFQITPFGTLNTLVQFMNNGFSNNGINPAAPLVLGTDGNFYGTTASGGGVNANGTIFQMTPAGTLTSLVQFTGTGGNEIGSAPGAGILQIPDGNFYGTTYQGGASNLGTVFKTTPAGGITTLLQFTGTNGSSLGNGPSGALVTGTDGNFYGVTTYGGAHALARKRTWARKNKAQFHTVVIDDSKVFNANGLGKHDDSQRKIYYRRGAGSFRVAKMYECKNMSEVKTMINTPTKKLPVGAK